MYKIVCFTLLCVPVVAFAQNPDTLIDNHTKVEELKMSIVAERMHASTAVAHTLDYVYLGRNSLLRKQGNTFINTLESIPGVRAMTTGVGVAKPVIRGLGMNRVIVNEFGIKQEGQQWGGDHGLELDQFNVDRVEVLKGPVSVMYGSDGIGGVINILPPIIPEKGKFSGEAITTFKSNNDLLGGSVKLQNNTNDYFTIFRTSYQNYASFKVPAEKFTYNNYVLPIENGRLKNTGGREFNVSLLQGVRRSWGQTSLYLSNYHQNAGFFIGAFGTPSLADLQQDGNYRKVGLPRQSINHFKAIYTLHLHLPKGRLEANIGYQHNSRSEYEGEHGHNHGQDMQVVGNKVTDKALQLRLQTTQLNVKYTTEKGKWNNTFGVNSTYQQNRADGAEFLIPSYQMFQVGLFDFAEIQWHPDLLMSVGLRMDYAHQRADSVYAYGYDNAGQVNAYELKSKYLNRDYYNLSLSTGLHYHHSHFVQYKMNIGSAFRTPTVNELLSNGLHHGTFRHEVGNANLKTENGILFDLGVYTHKGKMHWDVTPFVNYFFNYIYLNPSGKFSPLQEAGQIYNYTEAPVVFWGLESSMKWHFENNLNIEGAFEYVWNTNTEDNRSLPFTPPMSVKVEAEYKPFSESKYLNQTFIALGGQYFSAQNRTAANEMTTPGYFLANFSLSNTFNIGNDKLSVFFQIRNLLNTKYYNNMSRYRILNIPEQGRNFQVMLRYEF